MTHETHYRLVSDALAAENEEMFISAPWVGRLDGRIRRRHRSPGIRYAQHLPSFPYDNARFILRVRLDKGRIFEALLDFLAHRGKLGSGIRPCPIYVRMMIADLLGLVTVERR